MIGTASHSTLLKLPAAELEYALSKFASMKESLSNRVRAHLALNPSASAQLAHLLHLFTEPKEPTKPKNDNAVKDDSKAASDSNSHPKAPAKEPSRSRTPSPVPSPAAS